MRRNCCGEFGADWRDVGVRPEVADVCGGGGEAEVGPLYGDFGGGGGAVEQGDCLGACG